MRLTSQLSNRLRCDQRGFTLIELLVAMPLAVLIIFAALNTLDISGRSQTRTMDRAQAVTQAKAGLDRMVREVREASSFKLLTSEIVEIVTPVRPLSGASSYAGNLRLVRYDCTGEQCTRYEGPPAGPLGATGKVLFTDVRNHDIFTPTPSFLNPTFIGFKLQIYARGQINPINLTDGANLRNQALL